jgi:endonuclease/exonuclease/phosphatase family metal-dependent hydrolase
MQRRPARPCRIPTLDHVRDVTLTTTLTAALAVAALVAGCGGDDAPDDTGPRISFRVLTRNLYLGSELMSIVLVPTADRITSQAATFMATVQASDPVGRMRVLADDIAAEFPDLVALQEVELYRTQTPSNFNLDAPAAPDASEPLFDFLALLQATLVERGLVYEAVEHTLSDAELPAAMPGGGLMDVRLTDRDVILVRKGIAFTAGPRLVYQNHLPLVVGGKVPVKLVRGYHSVAIAHEGTAFTFVNSHLEVGGPAEPAQEGQARELVAALGAIPGALIVAGDFNSPADKTGTDSYEQLTRTLTDGWNKTVGDLAPGFTCCSSLSAASFDANSRIDLVMYRGSVRPATASVTGTDADRRTAGGLFGSDHAGVVMSVSLPIAR